MLLSLNLFREFILGSLFLLKLKHDFLLKTRGIFLYLNFLEIHASRSNEYAFLFEVVI